MVSDASMSKADEALASLHESFSGQGNGMAQVYVSHRGEELANLVVGEAGPVYLDIDDRLPIFSASKPLVAVTIARVWERGDLDIEAPVAQYLPAFVGGCREEVKIWHLLTHTHGLEGPTPPGKQFVDWGAWKAAAVTWDVQPGWTPGFRAGYSPQGGWVLLGMVLEACTGQPYDAAVDELVLRPLGLSKTSYVDEDRLGVWRWADERQDYVRKHEALIGRGSPGSGALSSARDLGCFYSSLLPGSSAAVLAPPTVSALTAHQRVRVEEEYSHTFAGHGLGFELDFMTRHDARVSYRSFGYSGSESVRIWADPEHQLVLGYMATVLPSDTDLHYERQRRLAEFAYGLAGIANPESGRTRHYGRTAAPNDGPRQSLRSIVIGVIGAYLGGSEDDIEADSKLVDDLMLDSVAVPEIIAMVSEEVGLEISIEESLFGEDLTLREFVLGLVFRPDPIEFED